ncbi:MAG TPA: DNA cytosine methyltransferase [Sedimentisphaerales bacterium]|nr:DNA cytosine methyltransferase [Sedimentisphaerales bacterium]
MRTIRHLGLFEGIGGFSIAARMRGWDTVAMVEWNPFCQVVLKHHFPDSDIYGDITKVDFRQYENKVEIITGGFPCQPFSTAGKRGGDGDDRFLWPEMLRAIKEVKPVVVIGENVPGIISIFEQQASASVEVKTLQLFDQVDGFGRRKDHIRIHKRIAAGVIDDLKQAGYLLPETEDGTPIIFCIPACGVEAPHERQRIFFVAYRDGARSGSEYELCTGGDVPEERIDKCGITADTDFGQCPERGHLNGERQDETEIGAGLDNRVARPGSDGDAADTNGERQKCEREPAGLGRFRPMFDNSPGNKPAWQNFPTQPPVCGGDDGLPRELDGISFSKWREESIKAYGNAVVPQLAFEFYELVEPILLHALKSRT